MLTNYICTTIENKLNEMQTLNYYISKGLFYICNTETQSGIIQCNNHRSCKNLSLQATNCKYCYLFTEPVLNCLLYCLQQPQLASAAANSLQSICSSCRVHMGVHFSGLVQIIQSLETFSISNEAAIGLLKGVSVILGRLPPEQIHQAMKEICWVQVKPLCELVQVRQFMFLS